MAVYKATYCYPFLNSLDIRLAMMEDRNLPAEYLKCKIDTSNKNITGYKIRLLDEANNQIFPLNNSEGTISPIEELQDLDISKDGINSGINGTYLQIPFFQNLTNIKLLSGNAIYYYPQFLVDYIIEGTEETSKWELDDDVLVWAAQGEEVIDGENLYANKVIVINKPDCIGVWKSEISQEHENNIILRRYDGGGLYESGIYCVRRGKIFHDTVWRVVEDNYIEEAEEENRWVDYNGTTIPGINAKGNIYKWEITLYQGDGIIVDDSSPQIMDYTQLDNDWLDMKLATGKILGSTPERIQIASMGNYADAELPNDGNNSLVLQTRYIDLTNLKDNNPYIFNGSRVYVQTYDATNGHIYPLADSLESTQVDNNTHCQFFKHSNNPEDILDTDIVDYGTNENVTFTYRKNGSWSTTYSSEQAWLNDTTVTNRIIEVTGNICGRPVSDLNGSTILLANQTSKKRNGVYEVYSISAGSDTHYCVKRAASYKTWGAYIGKVIYCSNGDLQGNIESLAPAGGYTLWDPLNSALQNGSSVLLFTQEMPILLFKNRLKNNRTFNFYHNAASPSNPSVIGISIDEQDIQVGDTILYKDGKCARITQVLPESMIYYIELIKDSEGHDIIVDQNDYVYISSGETHGHRVFKFGAMSTPNWELYTAQILKNDATHTFISPFVDLKKDMRLKLLNNKEIKYSSGVSSSWIRITSIYDKIHCIEHDQLGSDFEGRDPYTGGLYSYSSDDNKNIPWSYEVRSYFKASDENQFYSYELPYLYIDRDGDPFTSLEVLTLDEDPLPYSMIPLILESEENYLAGVYKISAPITTRYINLSGRYIQNQQASWESYRWVLLDASGTMLQDTGKRYDKSMDVTFYGLSNDKAASVAYYAVLYVEDDLGNLLEYIIKISVAGIDTENLLTPFKATFDCKTHSVILKYEDTGRVKPAYGVNDTIAVYSEDNKTTAGLWDGGLIYEKNTMSIVDKDHTVNAIIDYSSGSMIEGKDGFSYYGTQGTKSIKYGVNYSGFFSQDEYQSSTITDRNITLNNDDEGQMLLITSVELQDNYCGNFLHINVEGEPNDGHGNPVVAYDGTSPKLSGYLNIDLFIPPEENENYNKIGISIYKNGNKESIKTGYYFKRFDNDRTIQNYIQIGDYTPVVTEQYLHMVDDLFIKRTKNGEYITGSSNKFLGNCNIISASNVGDGTGLDGGLFNESEYSKQAPSYWSEDRYVITALGQEEYINEDYHHIDKNTNEHRWPKGEEYEENKEASSYWNEHKDSDSIDNIPLFWEDVSSEEVDAIEKVTVIDRYPGATNNLKIIIKLFKIQTIYNTDLSDLYFDENDDELYIKDGDNTLVGKIIIIKEEA